MSLPSKDVFIFESLDTAFSFTVTQRPHASRFSMSGLKNACIAVSAPERTTTVRVQRVVICIHEAVAFVRIDAVGENVMVVEPIDVGRDVGRSRPSRTRVEGSSSNNPIWFELVITHRSRS